MNDLAYYRAEIDSIDDQIIDLLAARLKIIHAVAGFKKRNAIPAILPDRVEEVINRNAARGESLGLDPQFIRALYAHIIDHACAVEQAHMDSP
jgi:chorismate mutase-like protein